MPLSTEDQILNQLNNYGLIIESNLVIGNRQRVPHQTDKKGAKSGWYILYEIQPGKFAGAYGCWKLSDDSHKFAGDATGDIDYRNIPMKLPEPEFEPDFSMWDNSEPAGNHPYLNKKGVDALGGVRQFGSHLLIPVMEGGKLVGLQTISGEGKKKFVKGSSFSGSHFTIKGNDTQAFVEGYATGATIHKVTGWTVHVCFSCHNMPKVARKYVGKPSVVCADNDEAGIRAGEATAKILACRHYVPPEEGDDWNDNGAEVLAGVEGTNFNSIPVGGDPIAFLQEWSGYLKGLPKSLQLIQAERFRADYGVTKELFKNIVSEAEVDEDGEERAEAIRQFSQYYTCEDKFYRIDIQGQGYWRVHRDEVRPLIELLAGEDALERNRLWQKLTGDRRIDRFESKVVIDGGGMELSRNESGAFTLVTAISLREVLLSAKRKLGQVTIPPHIFEKFQSYGEVIDCFKASLYRKILGSTKSTIYFRTCSDYGKTFFFDVEGISLSVRNDYDGTDFSGLDSHHLARYLFLFVDEADRFTSTMKKDIIGYDRKYGGYQTLRLPLRLLACANEIPDIEEGADEQILKRVTTIAPEPVKLDSIFGIVDHTLHKKMWDAFIIDLLINELDKVDKFSELYTQFTIKYRQGLSHKPLFEMVREAIVDLARDMGNNLRIKQGAHDLTEYIRIEEGVIYVLSPARAVRAIVEAYRPDRLKAFVRAYPNIRRLFKDLGSPETSKLGNRKVKCLRVEPREPQGTV